MMIEIELSTDSKGKIMISIIWDIIVEWWGGKCVLCILDIAPFNDGHVLILPKQHSEGS
jgi:Diadenosine tetraphosphate (Ap4A) hydrolase and other HIT family hydrolases